MSSKVGGTVFKTVSKTGVSSGNDLIPGRIAHQAGISIDTSLLVFECTFAMKISMACFSTFFYFSHLSFQTLPTDDMSKAIYPHFVDGGHNYQ